MNPPLRIAAAVAGLVLLALAAGALARPASEERAGARAAAGAWYALDDAAARRGGVPRLDDDVRAAGFRFAADVAPAWRTMVADAVARSRPEAARLIRLVDGLVEIRVAPAGDRALGVTSGRDGRFTVVLDMDRTLRTLGARGVDRLVLHELGHVVDVAIVPSALDRALDAQVPRGYACGPGERISACAPREERFAETFAKWATGDIGVDLNVGYAVAPPDVSPDRWGAPLTSLAEGGAG
jgi:hypothetical protein